MALTKIIESHCFSYTFSTAIGGFWKKVSAISNIPVLEVSDFEKSS